MKSARCIKMIGTRNFIVELMESESGSFYVVTEIDEVRKFSPPIRDLNTAMAVFDTTVRNFEGN
jgi:hypothetical protein